ncbi:hypothetical protein BDN71DRAFT_1390782 [Pleurotus eryngii]|uniref:RING-type domain-containing protein n=1 Tax=Pleurotus eryngii TaxID=5323 RepID=A0A9P6DGC1_PLEER|nr:hypothetical protein BDN71DRAFT_1390782 [Pleurotus eryngii]
MDTELKCNRLTCRRPVSDRAVVVRSHIFCVDCANELFNSSRLCPACETPLTEPDDVVVSSLHPTNDYKTSVLSGLSPSVILEICNRAISFWQYQIHQEKQLYPFSHIMYFSAFQQAVVRNMNDKNAQLQKQLENVVREANSEVNLLTNKVAELERDLELERRKVREVHEASRERDKEYQKLKANVIIPLLFATYSPSYRPSMIKLNERHFLLRVAGEARKAILASPELKGTHDTCLRIQTQTNLSTLGQWSVTCKPTG